MTSSTTPSAPPADEQGHLHIRIDADADLQRWARKFDTTPEQIKDAVAAVGDVADDVEMHLKGTRATSNADAELRGDQSAGPAGSG